MNGDDITLNCLRSYLNIECLFNVYIVISYMYCKHTLHYNKRIKENVRLAFQKKGVFVQQQQHLVL